VIRGDRETQEDIASVFCKASPQHYCKGVCCNLLPLLPLKASAFSIFWFRVTTEKLYNSSSRIRRYM
jgi:hypothetical protein